MPDFAAATPRHGLPYLYPGQSQKEVFVNQAHAMIDALLHPAISGEATSPPADPASGEAWLVGNGATGDWAGHVGKLAVYHTDQWLFFAPRAGMQLLDTRSGQQIRYTGEWEKPAAPPLPHGGEVIDHEARDTLQILIEAMKSAGIFPAN
ncbi:DUF2793 domain-containing protein [Altererythrobacter sp. FM1]|nr:DUF2793 domain-containing protein [Altererythrobacter sp. FM1]